MALISLLARLPFGPTFSHAPFGHWFDVLCSGAPHETRTRAKAAIDAMGDQALPKLIGVLREVTRAHPLERVATRIGPVIYEGDRNVAVPLCMDFLARIDPAGKTVVPEVAALINDPRHQPGRDWLVEYLLASYPNQTVVLRPWLIEWLEGQDPSLRLSVLTFLNRAGSRAQLLLPVLLKRLGKASSTERLRTIETLGAIGPAAALACPRLREFRQHRDEAVRITAGATLALIERQTDAALFELMLDRLERGSPQIKTVAERQFLRLGSLALPAAPGLIHILETSKEELRKQAASLLKSIAPNEAEASIAMATYNLEQKKTRSPYMDPVMMARYGLLPKR